MALTSEEYRAKAEAAVGKAETNAYSNIPEKAVAYAQAASVWAYLAVEYKKLGQ